MPSPIRPWPYAAKAVVQYEHFVNFIQLWVIFRHPMDQTVRPPVAKWIVTVDTVPKTPLTSVWLDTWTLTLFVINIPAHPSSVTVEYDGPDKDLRTTWGKQWEPWGAIDAGDVPFDWKHILDVDVPNARVTINGTLLLTSKLVVAGTYDDLDVAGVNILRLNSIAGDIIINGFSNGVLNQLLFLTVIYISANDVTLAHTEISGNQKLFLHAGADETLTNKYGGWNFFCDGFNWFDISHAKHV